METAFQDRACLPTAANGSPAIEHTIQWFKDNIPGEYHLFGDIYVGRVRVLPEVAAEILSHRNAVNRPTTPSQVRRLAKAMLEGRFLFNGEGLVFDSDGFVRNAQHRLRACVESNTPFETLIVVGVARLAFHTYDQHAKRPLAHVLAMKGEQHSKLLASTIPFVAGFQQSGALTRRCGALTDIDGDVAVLVAHPRVRESVAFIHEHQSHTRPFGSSGLVAAAHYVFACADRPLADSFFSRLFGHSIPLDDAWSGPRFLYSKLVGGKRAKQELHLTDVAGLTVLAWNALRSAKKVGKLVFDYRSQDFPVVNGLSYTPEGAPVLQPGDAR